ncbi:MAG TPA: DUF2905 family protein [Candidatus Hydrogenedens sp.]|nr:DUF2905 family protein [Candidatus Hydrogenedens sp.]
MNLLAKYFFVFGVIFILIGGVIWLSSFLPFKLGKLPGDIYIGGEKGGFYFPIVTCLVLSLLLTVLINLVFLLLSLFNR